MQSHFVTLAKVLEWGTENNIELKVAKTKEVGVTEEIELTMCKNGACRNLKVKQLEDLQRPRYRRALETIALDLSLTRLVL
jgi:hypothetical protein